MERHLFVPLLTDGDLHTDEGWHRLLASDYDTPQYHVSYLTAVARRVRNNYLWILLIQTLAYAGKITVHPFPAASVQTIVDRADIGPIPGLVVLALGGLYILTWAGLALWVTRADRTRARSRHGVSTRVAAGLPTGACASASDGNVVHVSAVNIWL